MANEVKDHYTLLGLERSASTEDIRRAYKDIARIYHPDSNFYSDIIEVELTDEENDKFKQITEAYSTLVDEDRRRDYDSKLAQQSPKESESKSEEGVSPPHTGSQRRHSDTMGRFRSMVQNPEEHGKFHTQMKINQQIEEMAEREKRRKLRFMAIVAASALVGLLLTFLLV